MAEAAEAEAFEDRRRHRPGRDDDARHAAFDGLAPARVHERGVDTPAARRGHGCAAEEQRRPRCEDRPSEADRLQELIRKVATGKQDVQKLLKNRPQPEAKRAAEPPGVEFDSNACETARESALSACTTMITWPTRVARWRAPLDTRIGGASKITSRSA